MDKVPEKVEVKRKEQGPVQRASAPGLVERVYYALFPIAGGLILDFADFVTMGSIGIYIGMIVGCLVGYLVSGIYKFPRKWRMYCTILAGIYCMIPGTFFLPLATIVSAMSRFYTSGRGGSEKQ